MTRACASILLVLMVGCTGGSGDAAGSTSTTPGLFDSTAAPATTSNTGPIDPSDPSDPSDPDIVGEAPWSAIEAERDVTNFLAALAAGAYEQAAWSASNNGVEINGQAAHESPTQALARLCHDGACAGPYTVLADGPGVIDPDSFQASSTVTVTHVDSGQEGAMRLSTFEGQRIIADLPPLVPSTGGAGLVEALFQGDIPARVVLARFDAFEIWENGQPEWVTNWWSGRTRQVEHEVIAGFQGVSALREPRAEYEGDCARLMVRDSVVLALLQCDTSGWRLIEAVSGDPQTASVPFEDRFDGEYVWFAERGGTVVHGIGDAEGNLTSLLNLDGTDLLGDGYAGTLALSTNGEFVAYVDHADPAALSHFWSPVVVVKETSSGDEVGRWTLDNQVLSLEFADSWLVAGEADAASVGSDLAEQTALVAINVESGDVRRVVTPTRVFLPS